MGMSSFLTDESRACILSQAYLSLVCLFPPSCWEYWGDLVLHRISLREAILVQVESRNRLVQGQQNIFSWIPFMKGAILSKKMPPARALVKIKFSK